jgi:hypothetical protein
MADLNTVIPAPAIPANGGNGKAFDLVFAEDADFAKDLGIDKLVPENAQPPRDTDGKFIAKDTVLADTTLAAPQPEQPAEAAQPEQPESQTPAEGQPAEEQPQAEKPKPPLTKFDVLDDAGQAVELPKVKLQFKADGKVVNYDLEKVVHLAQQNSFNARQVQTLGEQLQSLQQNEQQFQNAVQQYEHHISRMFQHPEVYDEARAAWLEANSPEKRVARLETQLQQQTQQQAAAQEAQRVAEFITGTILPSVSQLAEQFPHVTEDDLLGRFALYVPAYQVNGKVPAANLPKLQQFVETEIASWAAQVHDTRAKAIQAAQADAGKSLQKQQANSQALKRQVGKALAPVGTAAQSPQHQPKPIKKASDVLDDPMFGGPN